MDANSFGVCAMFAFWTSAIGSIFLAVKWANRKGKRSPATRDVMKKSLDKRLKEGEISAEEHQRRLKDL
ncbi:MAG: hypothetical protein A6F70_04100 [Cycloclasticus sp. symbiont of Bathymodiolus heckerae]|nr:MAG: hypothetical protein A6F70_04100 [Cycloclasticus sp. symbiont of Bathymodiolus heckerae]